MSATREAVPTGIDVLGRPPSAPISRRADSCELSVLMPCLNEAETIGTCIQKAQRAMRAHDIDGEVVVADNGSTDGSRDIALRLGARVIDVPQRGYGQALIAGIAAARGTFIVMGDADDSYDFSEIPRFVEKLRDGADLVQGCRLPRGGGRVLRGAMPATHRWIGNPLFSMLARWWFWAPVHDVYCGLRGFRKSYVQRLRQRCSGMEFATEMIIKASLDRAARIEEVPVTLHPDGRRAHPPHLRTLRDGWRTLRFFLLCTPRNAFVRPGLALIALGLLGYVVAMPRLQIAGVVFDAHTLVFATLAVVLGYQAVLFGVFAKVSAVNAGLLPPNPRLDRIFGALSLERALAIGCTAVIGGLALLGTALGEWAAADFGNLDYAHTMRWVLPGALLTTIGVQTVFAGLFACVLGFPKE